MTCAHCKAALGGVMYSINGDARKWCTPACMSADLPAPPAPLAPAKLETKAPEAPPKKPMLPPGYAPVKQPAASTPVHLPSKRDPPVAAPPPTKPAAPPAPEKKKPSKKGR